ncbi:uncharacterized protein LY89DRAFT_734183 [Mollisia scopiformis]|uniref:Uncharacterized protein n=1 Tax=Mollisia scopiformis TaxID=149040 RepID=A0A194XBR9_MOLSC|nr:uncharacterized protein LY89DRAFT_734183 [Mollisia scopiformis]KUJ17202.1 hypothetical protein LY89DRAFT_734183 [Mollisia scopiformis]
MHRKKCQILKGKHLAKEHFEWCWLQHVQASKRDADELQLILANNERARFIRPPELVDPDERILDYFGRHFAYNRTAIRDNAWEAIVKIAPERTLLMLVLTELFSAYIRCEYREKELMRVNYQSRASVLTTLHQWQSKVDLTGIDAESLGIVLLGGMMVVLQQMIGPDDDQQAWAHEILWIPFLIQKTLHAVTSVPKILPLTFELRAKLNPHITMANMLAPLHAQLPDSGYLAEAEWQNSQLMCTIDPLVGASHAIMWAIRETNLICKGSSQISPEKLLLYIKSIEQRYPEGGEPRDNDHIIYKQILFDGERGYQILAKSSCVVDY